MPQLSARVLYLCVVTTVGLAAVGHAVTVTVRSPPDYRWLVLCALTLIGSVATLKMRAAPVSFSISDSFTFATLLLFGPAPATLTASLEALTISCVLSPRWRRATRTLFNIAAVGLAMWVSGHVLLLFADERGPATLAAAPAWLALATAAAIGTYFLVNTWAVAFAIALAQRQRALATWRAHFVHLGFNYAAGAYIALLFVLFAPTLDPAAFVLLAPMPLVLYASERMWVGRINERVAHLDRMNRQYKATIEALAHAVDAKDHVTHGHIRRVQTACLRVARALGCTDDAELHALEAASLLHDLGKLAIPEHILNKPGPLTDAEYTRIKAHASIGAEILASIEFPYPVVPVVRHHHENWEGTGYPDGLAGHDIPLGARILAVVDCFDAVTSDRPYRPALSREEALAILRQRRGTMYDPLIVDQFLTLADSLEIPEPAARAAPAAASLKAREERGAFVLHDGSRLAAVAGPVLAIACRTAGAAAGVVFVYVEGSDAIAPVASTGLTAVAVDALHMQLGERLSGWVAASRSAQRESDAQLDLRGFEATLHAAASVPIVRRESLVGVMTLYGRQPGCFAGAPFGTLEILAAAIAEGQARQTDHTGFVSAAAS